MEIEDCCMLMLIITLLPLIIVGFASPALISVSILLLSGKQPLRTALSFVAGAVVILLTLGTAVLILFNGPLSIPRPEIGRTFSVILGLLFVLFGIRFYFKVPDPDAPPPQWIERLNNITPRQAFLLGLLLIGTNLKIVAAYGLGLNEIIQARIGLIADLIVLLFLLVFVLCGLIMPIAIYAYNPEDSDRLFKRLNTWVADSSRILLATVFFALGIYFAFKGFLGG